jgi:large subunit ribosomal protein L15e
MRFLQRVRCWEYRQHPSIVRVTHPTRPDKARRLGYKAKQVTLFLSHYIWKKYFFVCYFKFLFLFKVPDLLFMMIMAQSFRGHSLFWSMCVILFHYVDRHNQLVLVFNVVVSEQWGFSFPLCDSCWLSIFLMHIHSCLRECLLTFVECFLIPAISKQSIIWANGPSFSQPYFCLDQIEFLLFFSGFVVIDVLNFIS